MINFIILCMVGLMKNILMKSTFKKITLIILILVLTSCTANNNYIANITTENEETPDDNNTASVWKSSNKDNNSLNNDSDNNGLDNRDNTSTDITPKSPTKTTSEIDISTDTTLKPNEYSWDGSWNPSGDSPLIGLNDAEYSNLPPGKWDWNDAGNDFANYRNFNKKIGSFAKLTDDKGLHYGWKLIPVANVDYDAAGAYFEGSSGTDIINLEDGRIHSFGSADLGDGPDVLVFEKSYSLDFRTGSVGNNDNDLVIAGCTPNSGSSFDIATTTIHTGPGSDLVFVRDMERSAIDAGNGKGITSSLDSSDGNDQVVFRGNMLDFRFFGGNGND